MGMNIEKTAVCDRCADTAPCTREVARTGGSRIVVDGKVVAGTPMTAIEHIPLPVGWGTLETEHHLPRQGPSPETKSNYAYLCTECWKQYEEFLYGAKQYTETTVDERNALFFIAKLAALDSAGKQAIEGQAVIDLLVEFGHGKVYERAELFVQERCPMPSDALTRSLFKV